MDTTHIAFTAEDLIAHKLQRAGLLIAKPKFDCDGADLLAFMQVKNNAKFCLIQCKGRSLIRSKSSKIEVPKNYVDGAFILFLFIDDGDDKKTNLFCFFPEDIKEKWKLKTSKKPEKDCYFLSFSKSTFNSPEKKGNLTKYFLNINTIEKIKEVIKKADTKRELQKMFDLLKKQSELVKLQKKKYELEALIKGVEHTEEMKSMLDEKIDILEDNYHYLAKQLKEKNSQRFNKHRRKGKRK